MKEEIDLIFSNLKNECITEKQAHQQVLDLFALINPLPSVIDNMDIETAAVNAYKSKDLNEQRKNIDKMLAFENGAKWALCKLSNNSR